MLQYVARDVDTVDGERLFGRAGDESGRADRWYRRLDAGDRGGLPGHSLREKAAFARHDREGRPARHGIDHLDEGTQPRLVGQADGADQRDAARDGEHGERQSSRTTTREAAGHAERAHHDTFVMASALTPDDRASTTPATRFYAARPWVTRW